MHTLHLLDALMCSSHMRPSTAHKDLFCWCCWQEEVVCLLDPKDSHRDAATNACIVDNIKGALRVNSACSTEQQRSEYLIGLAYVAPPRLQQGDKSGMIRRIAERLELKRGRSSWSMHCVTVTCRWQGLAVQ